MLAAPSSGELRKEVRRLLRDAQGFIDPEIKQELASRAFELAQRAERIDLLAANPERLEPEIKRCRSMLMEKALNPDERRIVREALADAEAILRGLRFRSIWKAV